MSDLTEMKAELTVKIAQYRAAAVKPTHGGQEVNYQHDAHLETLLKQIDGLQNLIVKLGGATVIRTQLLG